MRLLNVKFLITGASALVFLHVETVLCQGPIGFLGNVEIPGTFTTDVWGYVDTLANKEYALVGDASGTGLVIVDVSNPLVPVRVATVPSVPGFDVKGWQHYAYTVTGGGGSGGIVDISDPGNPQVVGTFPSSHNIFIAENGYMYSEAPGLRIYDLNQDPTNPELVWSDGTTGGHDASVIDDRLYDFHGSSGTNIYDVADPSNPQLLGSIDPPSIRYHHSGWVSEDGNYLFICDELASHPLADITVWDISDVRNPEQVGEFADSTATVHNLYIIGEIAYVSYYTAGLRVLDISDPTEPVIIDEYDTSPESGEGFAGAFGVYPFAPSGHIYISDWDNGLYIFLFPSLLSFVHEPLTDTEDSDGPYVVTVTINAGENNALVPGTAMCVSGLNADFTDTTYLLSSGQSGEFTTDIPGYGLAGELTYYFAVQDTAGRWSTKPFGAPESHYSFNVGPDAIHPVIHSVSQIDDHFGKMGSVQVTTYVTDNIAVGEIFLEYSFSSDSPETTYSVPMDVDGAEWKGELGWESVPWHTVVTYWVKAIDSTSQLNETISEISSFQILNWTPLGNWEAEDLSDWDTDDGWGFVGFGDYGKVINDSPDGTYRNNAENILSMVNFIDISSYNSAYLSFRHLSLLEEDRDFGYVELSSDGVVWDSVTSITGMGLQRDEVIDLSPYMGEGEVWLRFRMMSDEQNVYGGWFIDDILFAVDTTFETSSIVKLPNTLPDKFSLEQNYPNPFNAVTTIAYTIPEMAHVRLTIHDLLGREVATMADGLKEAGRHEVEWNAGGLASGIYVYRLMSDGLQLNRKLVLLK
ncbi:MAG: choice-of-anchor B family protein [Candidatus Neomarinimicrobiota bacterium]